MSVICFKIFQREAEAGQMAWWLKALSAEELGLVLSTHLVDRIHKQLHFQRISAPFCPSQALHIYGTCTYMQANVHTYKIKTKNL